MSVEEFVNLKRAMGDREVSIRTHEYERRIVVADLGRIELSIATDRAFIANAQARIDAHWFETFSSEVSA